MANSKKYVGDRTDLSFEENRIVAYQFPISQTPSICAISRAINVANAQPDGQGVATVNPIFTWVRLAQRIPVRIHIDHVPPDVILAAGMTATVEINDRGRSSAK